MIHQGSSRLKKYRYVPCTVYSNDFPYLKIMFDHGFDGAMLFFLKMSLKTAYLAICLQL